MKADSNTITHNETKRSPAPRLTFTPPTDLRIRPETTRDETKPKLLKRTQAEKRIDFLLQKHFDNDPDFRPLIHELAEYDPTTKKKYLAWLVKHWTGDWSPDNAELKQIRVCLTTHQKGAKYFGPLTMIGLQLEDAGYHTDIFSYTPQTIQSVQGEIETIIRIDEENKQIRKGDLVLTAGAEIAYQDDEWTLLRIRSNEALERFGQGTSWCVRYGDAFGYRFPFDLLLTKNGERYLANGSEVRDRWDKLPPDEILNTINRVRKRAIDNYKEGNHHYRELASAISKAARQKVRLDASKELQLFDYPKLAIAYAEEVLGGRWLEFENQVRVSDLSAALAVDYAIQCRRERWYRLENKIKRSVQARARYREAFPGSIPKTEEEVFKEEVQAWRAQSQLAHRNPLRNGTQGRAEERRRSVSADRRLLRSSPATQEKYARLFASLVTSEARRWYCEKLKSYFDDFVSEVGKEVNLPIARLLSRRFGQRIEWLEPMIAKDAVCSMNYAVENGERFIEGEAAIRGLPELWKKYQQRFFKTEKSQIKWNSEGPRVMLPTNIKTASM